MAKTGHLFDSKFLLHDTGPGHPERADRLRAIESMIQSSHLNEKLTPVAARQASRQEIEAVHTRQHVDEVARTSEASGTYLDGDTYASSQSYEAAKLAAGGLLECVDRVWDGALNHAFAMVRPPGHHAESGYAMGFCLFNNVAIAAEHLIRKHGLKRVAIVDYDVHHGNATQHSFYERPDVFYISTHRYPFYPGTGAAEERGSGAGAGYNLNFPMRAGAGDEVYRQVFDEQLIPALREYRPQFLLVSAGFDAHRLDPLGGMNVTEAGFGYMTRELQKVAADFCDGKAVYTLEGGYDLKGLADSVKTVLEILVSD